MILLKGRVFKLVLLLAIAATMPNVIKAQTQMSEIPLGSGSSGGGTQSFAGGALLEGGDTGSGGLTTEAAGTSGPEAATFDGTYVWVATQFNNSITRIRVSDGAVAGTFTVGKRPVALLYAAGSVWVANLLSNSVMKITPSTGAIAGTFTVTDGPGGLAFDRLQDCEGHRKHYIFRVERLRLAVRHTAHPDAVAVLRDLAHLEAIADSFGEFARECRGQSIIATLDDEGRVGLRVM